ncbi:hypothetical protein ACFOSH_45085, partial [Amycolatopsis speibonae]
MAGLSGGQIDEIQANGLTQKHTRLNPLPKLDPALVPGWVKAFRPGEEQWYEGEHGGKLEKYDDLLSLLQAKKDQLPVNISLERTGKGYSDPLRWWAEVWIREYWKAKFDATTGKSVSSASLAKRSGRIVSSKTVCSWKLGSSQSVAEHSVHESSSGPALPGSSDESGVGASTTRKRSWQEAMGSELEMAEDAGRRLPGAEMSRLGGPGSGVGAGSLGLTEDGMPSRVVPGAEGDDRGWQVSSAQQRSGGLREGTYTVPAPDGGLGLDRPQSSGGADPVASGAGAEGRGVTGAGASEAFLEALRAGAVPWGVGPGRDGSLKAYLRDNRRSGLPGRATQTELQYWVRDLQDGAVRVTGMRVPLSLVVALSDGQINENQAKGLTTDHAKLKPRPKLERSPLPDWVMEFRPGVEEGQFPDLLSLLQANRHRLPVNISLVRIGKGYSKPLQWWAEVWLRAYRKEKLRELGEEANLTSESLARLAGYIVNSRMVRRWKLGLSESVADLSVGDAPSGSAVAGRSGGSGVGASPTPTPLPSGLGVPGSGSGVGASGFAEDGMPSPVVPGAGGGGGGWQVSSELQYSGGRFEGGYAVPVPLAASDGGLGLDRPPHLVPGGADLVSSGAGAEGQGVTGAGSSDALRAGVPAGLPWGAGPGEDGSLDVYLKKNRRPGLVGPATPTELQYWVRDLQAAAVTVTGMRVPAPLVADLSGGQINEQQAQDLTRTHAKIEARPERVLKLMPDWLKAFRPDEEVLHEGERKKYDNLLLLLQAKKDQLPVNISLERTGTRYSEPLRLWAEVWLRAYQEAELRKTEKAPELKDLVPLVGGIAGSRTVDKWNSGFPQRVEDLPVGDAPSDSVLAGPSGGSGVGASLEVAGPQMLQPGSLSSGLEMAGSGVGAGAPGFSTAGVPVVSGAGGGGGWLVGSVQPEQVGLQGLSQVEMEGFSQEFRVEMSERLWREEARIQPAPVGVIIGEVGSLLGGAAWLLPKEDGVHGVVLLDEEARHLDAIERALQRSGWREGEAIRLFGCETGDGVLWRLALDLWVRFGVAVEYPVGLLWLGVRGPGPGARVAKLDWTGDGVPELVLFEGGGGWARRVTPNEWYPDGLIEGETYTVPAPDGGLGLGLARPRHLAPGDTDPVSSDPGTEGQGVTSAGASEAFLEAVRKGEVPWGAGPGRDGSLKAYLRDNRRSGLAGPATPTELQDWVKRLQDGAVRVTGMRVPLSLVAVLSGGQINANKANGLTQRNARVEPSSELDPELVPDWVKAFRPGEVQWYEGEWYEEEWYEGGLRQYDDLLELLQANRHRLPVNIWLVRGGQRYSEPLRRWIEVWEQAYHNAPSGSAVPGPSGGSGVGASPTPQRTPPEAMGPELGVLPPELPGVSGWRSGVGDEAPGPSGLLRLEMQGVLPPELPGVS